jgi:hypothetical protein
VWVRERSGSAVPRGSGAGPVASGAERERGALAKGKERPGQVESAVRPVRSVGGSAVPGRSRSERSSGVRTGGGMLRQP